MPETDSSSPGYGSLRAFGDAYRQLVRAKFARIISGKLIGLGLTSLLVILVIESSYAQSTRVGRSGDTFDSVTSPAPEFPRTVAASTVDRVAPRTDPSSPSRSIHPLVDEDALSPEGVKSSL